MQKLGENGRSRIVSKRGEEKGSGGNGCSGVQMKDLNGKDVSLTDFRGKYVVLDFWEAGAYGVSKVFLI